MKGPSNSYISRLDEAIINEIRRAESEDQKKFPLRPSSAGKCTRELAYEVNEFLGHASYEKKEQDPASYRLLSLGHSVEWNLLKHMDLIENMDITYKQQVVELFKIGEKTIEGALDAVIISDKCVIDVKSKKNKFAKAYKDGWDEDDDWLASLPSVQQFDPSAFYVEDLPAFLKDIKSDPFLQANFLQLNLYANSKFLKDRGIDHAALLYYNKNDSRLREIRFVPSEKVLGMVEDKFRIAYEAGQANDPEAAPRDHTLGSMKCAFCPYSKQCHGDVDTLKEWFKTFPKKEWPTDYYKVKGKKEQLAEAYKELKWASEASEAKGAAEQEIIKIMQAAKITKIRFEDDRIYELKFYKSPYPHMKLVEGKL